MAREYTVLENGYIQYEENGYLYVIPNDEANSDYQRYLNPEAEQSTPSVIDADKL
jgi:hypothetical protein